MKRDSRVGLGVVGMCLAALGGFDSLALAGVKSTERLLAPPVSVAAGVAVNSGGQVPDTAGRSVPLDENVVVHDVSDLVFDPVFTVSDLRSQSRKTSLDDLVFALRQMLPEDSEVRTLINGPNQSLIVRGTQSVQDVAKTFLSRTRANVSRQISVEVRVIHLPSGSIRALPPRLRDPILQAVIANTTSQTQVIDDDTVRQLFRATQDALAGAIVQSPRLTCFANQTIRLYLGSYHFFTSDYSSHAPTTIAASTDIPGNIPDMASQIALPPSERNAQGYYPVFTPVFEGMEFQVLPQVSPDDKTAAIHLRYSETSLLGTHNARFEKEPKLELTRPDLSKIHYAGQLSIPDQQSALICVNRTETKTTLLLLRPTIVEAR